MPDTLTKYREATSELIDLERDIAALRSIASRSLTTEGERAVLTGLLRSLTDQRDQVSERVDSLAAIIDGRETQRGEPAPCDDCAHCGEPIFSTGGSFPHPAYRHVAGRMIFCSGDESVKLAGLTAEPASEYR